jgi:hypothetical protein
MRSQPRNPRSFVPTGEDAPNERELRTEEGMVIEVARHAMRSAIDQFAPPSANKLSLLMIAVVGQFADLMAGLPYAPELAVVCNKQIERAGWRLVPVPRN